MLSPFAPRGTRRARRWTTDWRAARSKMGAAMFAGRKPEKSLVAVAAVTATGLPF
jgi:hypothetical protein